MPTTILVEPSPSGHRPQAVATVGTVAARTSDVLVLTSVGAPQDATFQEYLSGCDFRIEEAFDDLAPRTREIAEAVAQRCAVEDVDRVVVMDADQTLKWWWWAAPRAFGLRKRPRIIFMLTRYPAKLRLADWQGWRLRIPKAGLALIAIASGSLHRVAGFSGRDDMTRGWVVKRARDPQICTAHSRDRHTLRGEHNLPRERRIVGIFGGISERKYPRLTWETMQSFGIEADLLLAGKITPEVKAWLSTVEPSPFGEIIVRDEFLSNSALDQYVAAVDVAALVMPNNGPSGIMGKALAAGVPVMTAGSVVRAREARATDGGEVADMDGASIAAALVRALARDGKASRLNTVPPATASEFGESLLGVPPDPQGS